MISGLSIRVRIRRTAWFVFLGAYIAAVAAGIFGAVNAAEAGADVSRSESVLYVTEVSPGSEAWYAEIAPGDIVIEVNGLPAAGWQDGDGEIRSISASAPGSDAVKNADTDASVAIPLISLNALGIVFAVTSVLMFFRARPTSEITSFAFLAIVVAIALASAPASVANHYWARIIQGILVHMGAIFFAAFFLVFGRSQSEGGRRLATWAPEVALLASAIAITPWLITLAGVHDFFGPLKTSAFAALAVSLIGGLGLAAWRYRHTDADTKEKIRIAALGTALGLTPFIWLSIIPPLFDLLPLLEAETTGIGLALIPLSFGYAVQRHQLMGMRSLVHRGTAYAIITAALIVLLGSILIVANLLLPDPESFAGFEVIILAFILVTVPFVARVRRRAMSIVDRILYRGVLEPQEIIRTLNAIANEEDDLQRLLQRTVNLMGEGLDLEFAWFFSDGPQTISPIVISYRPIDAPLLAEARDVLPLAQTGVRTMLLPNSEQTVIIGNVHGVGGNKVSLVLGPRRSEEPFNDETVQLVQTVCGTLTATVARIQLLAEVKARTSELQSMGSQIEHIQEEERQEISSYLHDEPLQKVAYALAQMRERSLPEDLASLLEDVARDLRSTAASLSPNVLRDSGLVTAVRWLVNEQKRRNEFSVFLEFEGFEQDVRFSEAVELAAYRVIQEALNNCRKHSRAKAVWINVDYTPGTLTVSVEDNGVGFSATAKNERKPDEGLGIRALKQRVAGLGGNLTLSERASRGAAIKATFPLADEAARAAI